jgi:plasmid stabilization system protein ParE
MTYQILILPQAHLDINRNAEWWADHHSIDQAERWADAVYDQIETLDRSPESYAISAENETFSVEIRDKLVGLGRHPNYRAIFTVLENVVYVLAVRRAAQDAFRPDDCNLPPTA